METVDGARALSALHAASHESGGSDEIDLTGLSGALAESDIAPLFPGLVIRPTFTYKDGDEIYASAGVYHHVGTTEQLVCWDSQLAIQNASPTANAFNYLYLDDSAIVTLGSNLLTASEFTWSDTAPSWSESKHGFYIGDDRCIFSCRFNATPVIQLFYHNGGEYVEFDSYSGSLGSIAISNTWTDVTLRMPNFGDNQQALVNFLNVYVNNWAQLEYRKNGSSVTGNSVGLAGSTSSRNYMSRRVTVDIAQKIEVRYHVATANQASVHSLGWFFPHGM